MIDFKTFEHVIQVIKDHDNFNRNFSKFLEQNICTDSYCYVDIGRELQKTLIELLCDIFKIPKNVEHIGNDIEWWLYEGADKKIYYKDGSVLDVNNIKDFYNYLLNYKVYDKISN